MQAEPFEQYRLHLVQCLLLFQQTKREAEQKQLEARLEVDKVLQEAVKIRLEVMAGLVVLRLEGSQLYLRKSGVVCNHTI